MYIDINDKFREECGVFGIFNNNNLDVAKLTYYALYALQHRGQESSGIAVNDNGTIMFHKDMGLVSEVFNDIVLNHLKGDIAIGHVRYSTAGASLRENAQPMVAKYRNGQIALAHNGNLINASKIREKLEESGALFQSTIDSEVILNLISRYRIVNDSIEDSITSMLSDIKGSYSMVILTPKRLIGIRDSMGIRPLCMGKIDDSYILASESCALDAIGAEFVRDIEPGEIVFIDKDGVKSVKFSNNKESKFCIFEHLYFARPDSIIDGASVHQSRIEAGRRLAKEHPADADIVIGVPDSGLTAAIGFSEEAEILYGQGLIKNRYVGRTFIQPGQLKREMAVKTKLNALRNVISGKRVVMIDDSIVRGTTCKRIVNILKQGGAKEVHLRIAAPPVKYPCFFGIDTPHREQLVAANHSVEEIRKLVNADSIGFLSLESLIETPVGSKCGFCTGCFDGKYPIELGEC